MGGPLGSRMPPSASMMMPGSNPYGPSGPPPPSLSSTPFSAPSGGMSGTPAGRVPSMYPGAGAGPGPGLGATSSGVGSGGGTSLHQPQPSTGAGGTPTSKPPSVLNTIQLQQLSAQLKAYKLLARNVSPPEALISIVHGRKPTQAMLAALGKQQQQQQQQQQSSQSPSSLGVPPSSLGDAQRSAASEGGSGGNISLYPLSPNVSQGASPVNTQSQPLVRSNAQSLSTSMSAPGGGAAPNVTISSSGELPLPIKQAISAAQSRSSNTPPSGQQASTPPTSMSPAPGAEDKACVVSVSQVLQL